MWEKALKKRPPLIDVNWHQFEILWVNLQCAFAFFVLKSFPQKSEFTGHRVWSNWESSSRAGALPLPLPQVQVQVQVQVQREPEWEVCAVPSTKRTSIPGLLSFPNLGMVRPLHCSSRSTFFFFFSLLMDQASLLITIYHFFQWCCHCPCWPSRTSPSFWFNLVREILSTGLCCDMTC